LSDVGLGSPSVPSISSRNRFSSPSTMRLRLAAS
jgi:hypothetical protein